MANEINTFYMLKSFMLFCRPAKWIPPFKKVKHFQNKGYPVISVDAKKKENIGKYKNTGKEWEKKGQPTVVNTYDFPDKGKACPYGIFDITRNEGWVNVGISRDTA